MQEIRKEFIKEFQSMSLRVNVYKRWQDMVELFAMSFASALDPRENNPYEDRYMTIVKEYEDSDIACFSRLLGLLTEALEEKPFQDFLGQTFMELGLGNGHAGQFFTPYHIAQVMARMTVQNAESEILEKGYISVHEPSCGGGATLIAAAEALQNLGINYQEKAFFTGQDLDSRVAMTCFIQLSLIGCPGWIRIGDTLADPPTCRHIIIGPEDDRVYYTPMYFSKTWTDRRFECIVRDTLWR